MVLTPGDRHVVDTGLHAIGMVRDARADLLGRHDGSPSMIVLLNLIRTLNSERLDPNGSARQAAAVKLLIRAHVVNVMGVEETRSINRPQADQEGAPVLTDGSTGTVEFTLMPTPVSGMNTADIFRDLPPDTGITGTPLVIVPPVPRAPVQTDPNATPPVIVNPGRKVP